MERWKEKEYRPKYSLNTIERINLAMFSKEKDNYNNTTKDK